MNRLLNKPINTSFSSTAPSKKDVRS